MKRLNLGCGTDIKKGWVNLDKFKYNDSILVHDLNKLPISI